MSATQTKFSSSFKYNPLNPRNWRLFCKINVISDCLLIIDFFIGISSRLEPLNSSFLTSSFPTTPLFFNWIPFATILFILWISPLLNKDLNDTAFFGAIAIKVLLNIGSIQFTWLGLIVEYVLNLYCSIVIGMVLFFIIILEVEEPFDSVKALTLGLVILAVNLGVNFLINGWRTNETWGALFIIIVAIGITTLYKKWTLAGTLLIVAIAVINDYIVPFKLGGFGIGASIVSLSGLFMLIHWFMNR